MKLHKSNDLFCTTTKRELKKEKQTNEENAVERKEKMKFVVVSSKILSQRREKRAKTFIYCNSVLSEQIYHWKNS